MFFHLTGKSWWVISLFLSPNAWNTLICLFLYNILWIIWKQLEVHHCHKLWKSEVNKLFVYSLEVCIILSGMGKETLRNKSYHKWNDTTEIQNQENAETFLQRILFCLCRRKHLHFPTTYIFISYSVCCANHWYWCHANWFSGPDVGDGYHPAVGVTWGLLFLK